MNSDVQELLGVLDIVLDDLAKALCEQYANVTIDLNISAIPNQQHLMGIPPFNAMNSRTTRF